MEALPSAQETLPRIGILSLISELCNQKQKRQLTCFWICLTSLANCKVGYRKPKPSLPSLPSLRHRTCKKTSTNGGRTRSVCIILPCLFDHSPIYDAVSAGHLSLFRLLNIMVRCLKGCGIWWIWPAISPLVTLDAKNTHSGHLRFQGGINSWTRTEYACVC